MTAGKVIPAAEARTTPAYPVARLVKGAVLEAQQAKADALRVLADAEEEAQRVRDQAILDSEATRAAGVEKARREIADRAAALLESLEQQVARQRQAFGSEVQRVALRVARAMLDVEFAVRPEHVIRVVEQVLDQAALRREIRVHVHPSAMEHLRSQREALMERAPAARTFELKADPDLPPHDVRIETEWGNYGSTLDARFAELAQSLADAAGVQKEPT